MGYDDILPVTSELKLKVGKQWTAEVNFLANGRENWPNGEGIVV